MNLLGRQLAVGAAIVLTIGGLGSCEDPGDIGLLVDADNGVVKPYYVDVTLPTSVVQFDLRSTKESRSIQAGMFTNPHFGTVVSKSYSQLALNIVIPPATNAEYRGFELEIAFQSMIGDEPPNSATQKIGIYQLAEPINPKGNYTRVDELSLRGEPLGTWVFAPKRNDTLQTDTTFTVPLDNTVGLDLFEKMKAGHPIFDDDEAFNQYFNGVAFVPAGDNIDIFYIDPSKVFFIIKYVEFNSNGVEIEREYEINIGQLGFHHIASDLSGTPLSGIQPDNSDYYPADDYRYLQYGTMMAIRADLTPFYELVDTLDNMVVNKAEIRIGGITEYGENYEPPNFLQVYFTDETNAWPVVDNVGRFDTAQVGKYFIMLQDEEKFVPPGAYYEPLSAFYDPDNKFYSISMSLFFQNYSGGRFTDPAQPFLEEKGQVFIFGESSVELPQKTSSHTLAKMLRFHKDSIRFRIHYTIPNFQGR